MADGLWLGSLTSGLIAGIFVAFVSWAVSAIAAKRAETKARRRRILLDLARARALVFRAVRDRVYESYFLGKDHAREFERLRKDYDDVTVRALELFVSGEEKVAAWTAYEFYAGFWDPLHFLQTNNVEPDPNGFPMLPFEAEGVTVDSDGTVSICGYLLPRPEMLADWARNGSNPPHYGDLFDESGGDRLRHRIVIPNSDVNADILRAPISYIKNERTLRQHQKALRRSLRGMRRA